jgi:hypothetical protein
MQKKIRLGMTIPLQDRETMQSTLGRTEAMISAARAYLKESMAALLGSLDEDHDELLRARVRLRIACAFAAESSASVVHIVSTEAGAASIFESNALERAGRDINAAIKHVAMSPQSYTVAGRLDKGNVRI